MTASTTVLRESCRISSVENQQLQQIESAKSDHPQSKSTSQTSTIRSERPPSFLFARLRTFVVAVLLAAVIAHLFYLHIRSTFDFQTQSLLETDSDAAAFRFLSETCYFNSPTLLAVTASTLVLRTTKNSIARTSVIAATIILSAANLLRDFGVELNVTITRPISTSTFEVIAQKAMFPFLLWLIMWIGKSRVWHTVAILVTSNVLFYILYAPILFPR